MLNNHIMRFGRKHGAFNHRTSLEVADDVIWGILLLGICTVLIALGPTKANSAQMKPIVVKVSKVETASWYAKHGDRTDPWVHQTTASGETFDENDLTAASWKYPLGSMVRVINIKNGHSVIVRINDRGPSKRLLAQGRTMDLSKGAFEKIADLDQGVIKIRTVVID